MKLLRPLLAERANPILFCRFIATAEHVAAGLRKAFPKLRVEVVTGLLTPEDRRARVEAMGDSEQRVLVATDCLSEGVNLQHLFDVVVHYDLSWNPTRHQQREGRVDRFGQPAKIRPFCAAIFARQCNRWSGAWTSFFAKLKPSDKRPE